MYNHYAGDPYWTTARFNSRCKGEGCYNLIKKGQQIYYYPRTKTALCEECGRPAERQFISMAQDEYSYNH